MTCENAFASSLEREIAYKLKQPNKPFDEVKVYTRLIFEGLDTVVLINGKYYHALIKDNLASDPYDPMRVLEIKNKWSDYFIKLLDGQNVN